MALESWKRNKTDKIANKIQADCHSQAKAEENNSKAAKRKGYPYGKYREKHEIPNTANAECIHTPHSKGTLTAIGGIIDFNELGKKKGSIYNGEDIKPIT